MIPVYTLLESYWSPTGVLLESFLGPTPVETPVGGFTPILLESISGLEKGILLESYRSRIGRMDFGLMKKKECPALDFRPRTGHKRFSKKNAGHEYHPAQHNARMVKMPRTTNLTGQKFGRLTVLCRTENDPSGNVQWFCRCDCGAEMPRKGTTLQRGVLDTAVCMSDASEPAENGKGPQSLCPLRRIESAWRSGLLGLKDFGVPLSVAEKRVLLNASGRVLASWVGDQFTDMERFCEEVVKAVKNWDEFCKDAVKSKGGYPAVPNQYADDYTVPSRPTVWFFCENVETILERMASDDQ